MKITKDVFGKDAKVKYVERFKARGAKRNKVRSSDYAEATNNAFARTTGDVENHAYLSKPEHEKRFANLADCFPLLKIGH